MLSKTKKINFSSHLFLPPRMRDFASCFSEQATQVSNSSRSGSCNSSVQDPSAKTAQSAITCIYKTKLSTQKELLIRVTWSKGQIGPALSIGIDDNPSEWRPNSMDSSLLRKMKGNRSYVSGNSMIGMYWDLSSANYGLAPEPIEDFYVVVIIDGEFGLLLGEKSREFIKKFEEMIPTAEFSLISRREQVLGHTLYSTKARFHVNGGDHDILIRCKGDVWDTKDSELSVCIDKKKVVHVRRPKWNFRGNQTIFIDGSPVDMMWDVHGWWFCNPSGYAVFMFRTRSALESRLWLEEELLQKEQSMSGFSLLIQVFKSP